MQGLDKCPTIPVSVEGTEKGTLPHLSPTRGEIWVSEKTHFE